MSFSIPRSFDSLGCAEAEDVEKTLTEVRNELFSSQTPLRLFDLQPQIYSLIASVDRMDEHMKSTFTSYLHGWIQSFCSIPESSYDRDKMWTCLKIYVFILSEWLNRVNEYSKKLISRVIKKLTEFELFQVLRQREPGKEYVARMMSLMFPLLKLGESTRGLVYWVCQYKTENLWEEWSARLIQLLISSGKQPETLLMGIKDIMLLQDDIAKHILHEVVQTVMKTSGAKGDADSFRGLGRLLEEIAQICPRLYLSELGHPAYLLNNENYLIRNGVIAGIRECVFYLRSDQCEIEPITKQERLCFLIDILESRCYDGNAYARQKVIDAFFEITKGNVLPMDRFLTVLSIAKERLRDKTAIVRKSAGKLAFMLLGRKLEEEQNMRSKDEIMAENEKIHQKLKNLSEEIQLEDFENQKTRLKLRLEMNEFALNRLNLFGEIASFLFSLLESLTSSDVKIAIDLLFYMQHAGIPEAQFATQKILPFIWKNDDEMKKDIMNGFHALYINRDLKGNEDGLERLVRLYDGLFPGEKASLEEVMTALWENKVMDAGYFNMLLVEFGKKPTVALACFLRCAAGAMKENYVTSFDKLTNIALRNTQKLQILEEFLIAAAKIGSHGDKTNLFLIQSIRVLTDENTNFQFSWFSCASQLIKTIQTLSENPREMMRNVLVTLMKKVMKREYREQDLAKCMFAAGEIGLKVSIMVDKAKAAIQQISGKPPKPSTEMDQITSLQDAEFSTRLDDLLSIQNNHLLQTNLFRHFPRLISDCLSRFPTLHSLTQMSVYLTLGKFMCISQPLCESFLPKFIESIKNKSLPTPLQCNLIVIFGDLVQRFPNVFEDYIDLLFDYLRDTAAEIRIKAMLIITHLVVNEMIKLREQAADILLLLVDENPTICNLVKLFLVKMKERHPQALQNAIPEALSKLSDSGRLRNEDFERIANRVLDQSSALREQQHLIERLCQKMFPKDALPRRRLCYCLARCAKSEGAVRRLLDNLSVWQPLALADPEVKKWFEVSLTAAKKNTDKEDPAVFREFMMRLEIETRELPHKTPGARGKKPS